SRSTQDVEGQSREGFALKLAPQTVLPLEPTVASGRRPRHPRAASCRCALAGNPHHPRATARLSRRIGARHGCGQAKEPGEVGDGGIGLVRAISWSNGLLVGPTRESGPTIVGPTDCATREGLINLR